MKFLSIFIVLVLISISLNAQVDRTNFRAGVNAGLVQGDFSDAYSFSLGIDIVYVWGLSRELDLGFATGFNNAFGEEQSFSNGGLTVTTEFDNIQYIPAAAALRIYPTYGFKFGGDVGYAVGVNAGNEGGLYYKPMVGVDMNGTTEIGISYAVISDDVTFSMVQLGVLFLF